MKLNTDHQVGVTQVYNATAEYWPTVYEATGSNPSTAETINPWIADLKHYLLF